MKEYRKAQLTVFLSVAEEYAKDSVAMNISADKAQKDETFLSWISAKTISAAGAGNKEALDNYATANDVFITASEELWDEKGTTKIQFREICNKVRATLDK